MLSGRLAARTAVICRFDEGWGAHFQGAALIPALQESPQGLLHGCWAEPSEHGAGRPRGSQSETKAEPSGLSEPALRGHTPSLPTYSSDG